MRRFALWLALLLSCGNALAEFSGNVAAQAVTFPDDAQFDGQFDNDLSFSFEPRWDGQWNDGDDQWSAELFTRQGSKDEGRDHNDIRELLWLHVDGDNEWRVGINTMFWGVAESQHLVDVVNQIDAVEAIDGEEKLGQPMIHLKRYQDWGVLDFLVLPYFRERSFHDKPGRLREPLVVDTDATEYQSSAGEHHIDYALRFSQTYDDLDLGISWFQGTRRAPLLFPGVDDHGEPVLIPYYEQMKQLGIDAQLLYLDWIWRLEMIHRSADSGDATAYVGGFEYTFYGVMDSVADIGAIVEYSYNDAPEGQSGVFDRDVFIGARFAMNDAQSSEVLAGFLVDTSNHGRSFRVEASRRIGASWKLELELQTFANIDEVDQSAAFADDSEAGFADDPQASFANDSYLQVEMAYYF
jgi:hypothetical protein